MISTCHKCEILFHTPTTICTIWIFKWMRTLSFLLILSDTRDNEISKLSQRLCKWTKWKILATFTYEFLFRFVTIIIFVGFPRVTSWSLRIMQLNMNWMKNQRKKFESTIYFSIVLSYECLWIRHMRV